MKGRCWILQPLHCPVSFFGASYLDPQFKGFLRGKKENIPYIMLPSQYEDLKRDVIDHMIVLVYKQKDSEEHGNNNEGTNKRPFALFMTPARTSQKLLSIMQRGK